MSNRLLPPQISPVNYIGSTQNLVNLLAASAADPTLFSQEQSDLEESESEEGDDVRTSSTSTSEDESPSTPTTFSTLNNSTAPYHTYSPTTTLNENAKSTSNYSTSISSNSNQSQSSLIKQLALDQADSVDDAVFRAQRKAASLYSPEEEGSEEGSEEVGGSGSRSRANSNAGGILSGEEIFSEPVEMDDDSTGVERLAKLTEEFGVWSDESEKFVQSIPGALYRGVLIKGVLALTNRRLFFFAYVPPMEHAKSIRSGPVTIHFPGLFKKSSRVWSDLTDDSVTWYKSSSTLYRPIGACRLSQVKEVLEYNEDEPYIVRLNLIDGRKRILELDTAESAMGWRNDIEATVFTFRSTADRLRFSLPLQRVKRVLVAPYMALAEKVELTFDAGICAEESACSISGTPAAEILPSSNLTTIEFGYIKSHHDFCVELTHQVDLSTTATSFCGGTQPILEIESDLRKSDQVVEQSDQLLAASHNSSDYILGNKFIETFALEDEAKDLFLIPSVELVRALPTWGSLVVSKTYLCFWRRRPIGSDVKLRIPLSDLEAVGNCKAFGFRIFGLSIQVRGAPDVRFDFRTKKNRDATVSILQSIILAKQLEANSLNSPSFGIGSSSIRPSEDNGPSSAAPLTNIDTSGSRLAYDTGTSTSSKSSPSSFFNTLNSSSTATSPYTIAPLRSPFEASVHQQNIFGQDLEENVVVPAGMKKIAMPALLGAVGRRKITGQHFVCLTIGSRGDVQPYIALGIQLMQDGNRVTIASHPEYRQWVESYGIGYREVGGDPAALMSLNIDHTLFSPAWFRESLGHFRKWLDDLFLESWEACQGADILIESPSTMAGIHVAEALNIPYFRAFTMPWTTTSTYPHAFGASVDLGPTYNSLSYAIFDGVIWKAISGQVNRFRKNTLHIPPTSSHKMSQAKTPFIYNFSSAVVPKPNDWKDFICISGYWFLDDEKAWNPPTGLLEFIEKARVDGKAIIYVGFGSIIVPDASTVTRAVIEATKNADVRVILSKGWSDRGGKSTTEEPIMPEEIFSVLSIAHDRLFPLIDAACHHGGAGSTGESLRAGLPTLIHPFFGDQFFWSSRVQKLGAGLRVDTLTAKDLTAAFKQGTTDRVMKEKAAIVGAKIRSENGVRTAINFITDHVHLAQERGDLRAARARKEKNKSIVHTRTFSSGGSSSPLKSSPRPASPSLTPTGRPSTPTRVSSSLSGAPLVSTPQSLGSYESSDSTGEKAGFKWCPIKNAMRRKSSMKVAADKSDKGEKGVKAGEFGGVEDQNGNTVQI